MTIKNFIILAFILVASQAVAQNSKPHIKLDVDCQDDLAEYFEKFWKIKSEYEYLYFGDEDDTVIPFSDAPSPPSFIECAFLVGPDAKECFQEGMNKSIRRNFYYPEEAQEQGIQGRVYVIFTINKAGNISDIRVQGPDKILEEDAMRLIKLLPPMLPAKSEDGKPIAISFSIPITWRLE